MDDLKHLRALNNRDWLKRLADPIAEIRQQMQAAYVDPYRKVREQMLDACGMQAVSDKFKAVSTLPSLAQNLLEQQRRHQEDYAKVLDTRQEWGRMIREITNPIRGLAIDTRAYLNAIGLGPGSELVRLLEGFREQLEKLPEQTRVQVAILIERGWCLDPEMTHAGLQDMVWAIEDGEEANVQAELVNYFRSRLSGVESTLKERHPQRAAIFDDAFKAHSEGRYVLSIPVFLAQADGITFDRVERQLFSRKHSKGVTGYVDSLPEDDLTTIYWSGFTIDADAPLTRDTRQLPPGFDGLNRHAVLHGTDPNYGTEINSLRAISVLNLASYLLTASTHDQD